MTTLDPIIQEVVDAAVLAALEERDAVAREALEAATAEREAESQRLQADARREAVDAEARVALWQGHTHTWGRAAKGFRTCGDCALELPSDMIGG